MDLELILNIPLTTRRQSDFWAWHYEKQRCFRLDQRTGCWLVIGKKRTDWIEHNAGMYDVRADQKDWTNLWAVKVPSNVRVFLWRLAKQSIPTGDVRHHRNMAPNNSCSICGCQDSWKHALLECNMAKCVWVLQREEILEVISQAQHDDARGWLHEAITALSQEDLVRLVVTMWSIWHTRRKVIHEDIF
jgi:hypothetical protein